MYYVYFLIVLDIFNGHHNIFLHCKWMEGGTQETSGNEIIFC